jgi:hypothetical protein
MEQLVINQLIQLLCKAGSAALIKDLLRETNVDGNTRHWTVEEIENANTYLNNLNMFFGKGDALVIIQNLMKEYHLTTEDLSPEKLMFLNKEK